MNIISKTIISYLVKENIIDTEEKDLYFYGIVELLQYLIFISTSLALGIIFNELSEIFIFLPLYFLFRSAVGGIHLSNKRYCFLASIVLIFIFLLFINFKIQIHYYHYLIVLLLAYYLIKVPLKDHKNKKYESQTLYFLQQRRNKIIILELILFYLSSTLDMPILPTVILFVFVSNSFSVLLQNWNVL